MNKLRCIHGKTQVEHRAVDRWGTLRLALGWRWLLRWKPVRTRVQYCEDCIRINELRHKRTLPETSQDERDGMDCELEELLKGSG